MKIKIICILCILGATLLFVAGCSQVERYGVTQGIEKTTSLKNILSEPKKYEGKIVKVDGKIVEECPTGCWFNLADDGGIIYVDLNPASFAIPQKVGKNVSVEGKVVIEDGNVSISGESAEIK